MSDAPSPTVDDDDPVVASYSVFLKPALPKHRKLFVLQYPNTFAGDPRSLRPPEVTEMRLKSETGVVEVDLPIDTSGEQYDRLKGKPWGAALKRTLAAKDGGSLGLAGGFGIGAPPVRPAPRRGQAAHGEDSDPIDMLWSEALRQDLPLRIKTLGGRAVKEVDARYMVAVFSGQNIHLTPVSSLVALRPNLQHLDASAEQDRAARSSAAAGGAGAKEGGPARAIHMTLKAAMDDGGVSTETIGDRLKAVQTELWRRMQYVHDEAAAAWEAYTESLVLNPSANVVGQVDKDEVGKGKQVVRDDDEAQGEEGGASAPDLVEKVPRLEGNWGEEDMLKAVSGFTTTEVRPGEEVAFAAAKASSAARVQSEKGKGKEVVAKSDNAEKAKPRSGSPMKASTASTTKRGTRVTRANAGSSSTAMEID